MFKVEYSSIPELSYTNKCKDKLVVVIDTLRATSTIVTALVNNANYVMPIINEDQITSEVQNDPENTVLCGERDCIKFDNFDYGNSPFEMTRENVGNKNVLLLTTNGTKLISESKTANQIICGSLLNAKAVAQSIFEKNQNCLLSCAGTDGFPTDEDNFTAGFIAMELQKLTKEFECDKELIAMMLVANIFEHNVNDFISNTKHAKRLKSLGFSQDVEFCSEVNRFNLVPKLTDNKFYK